MPDPDPEQPQDPPAPPVEEPEEDDDDSAIFTEILEELKAQVPKGVSSTIKSLSIPKQIKILKGLIKEKTPAEPPKKKPAKKEVKKEVKPTDTDQPAPPVDQDDPVFVPLVNRFENREKWLENFMSAPKLYYKGKFNNNL